MSITKSPPKIFLSVGEASGDLHASLLMQAISERMPGTEFQFWGGDKMEAVGGKLLRHYRDLAFMGFWEVIKNLRTIFKNLDDCFADIRSFNPDLLILVDYSGFNLRIAEKAHRAGIPVFYYISPQVWASRAGRVKKIKRFVDEMFVILPFEKDFYAQYDYPVHYIGHPLTDIVRDFTPAPNFRTEYRLSALPIIALLPGSRKQEIRMMLGEMLQLLPRFPDYQFVIAGAPNIPEAFYQDIIDKNICENVPPVRLIFNRTYDIFHVANAGLITSGTATLEAALFELPQVVCYKGSALSFAIAKRIIQVKYICLVNLILDKEVVKELIQDEMTAVNLKIELDKLLTGKKDLTPAYAELKAKTGEPGAPERAAEIIENRWAEIQHAAF